MQGQPGEVGEEGLGLGLVADAEVLHHLVELLLTRHAFHVAEADEGVPAPVVLGGEAHGHALHAGIGEGLTQGHVLLQVPLGEDGALGGVCRLFKELDADGQTAQLVGFLKLCGFFVDRRDLHFHILHYIK